MKPIGPLMREHRLIERMLALLKEELPRIEERKQVDPSLIDAAVDFFRTYADRTHHGKEEDILFRDLAPKGLSQEHKRIMDELTEEHIRAREIVGSIAKAKEKYMRGESDALHEIKASLNDLVKLYPGHIEKEDQHFFYPILEYFSKKEQDDMLEEFWEFDRNMIHEKYKLTVEQLGKTK